MSTALKNQRNRTENKKIASEIDAKEQAQALPVLLNIDECTITGTII